MGMQHNIVCQLSLTRYTLCGYRVDILTDLQYTTVP